MSEEKHTPGLLIRSGHSAELWLNGEVVALAVGGDGVVADEMVRRYNAHDELLAACRAALITIDANETRLRDAGILDGEDVACMSETCQTVNAAIAKATGTD